MYYNNYLVMIILHNRIILILNVDANIIFNIASSVLFPVVEVTVLGLSLV